MCHESITPLNAQQPNPSVYIWRDPHGGFYVNDDTGTQRVRTTRTTTTIQLDLHAYDRAAA